MTSAAATRSATKSRHRPDVQMRVLLIGIQYMQIRRESTVAELGTSVSGGRFSLSPVYSWDSARDSLPSKQDANHFTTLVEAQQHRTICATMLSPHRSRAALESGTYLALLISMLLSLGQVRHQAFAMAALRAEHCLGPPLQEQAFNNVRPSYQARNLRVPRRWSEYCGWGTRLTSSHYISHRLDWISCTNA